MPTNYRYEDKIRLTEVERAILLALLKGKMHTYELGQTMDKDGNEDVPYSNGTINPALKRLQAMSMVEKLPPSGVKLSAGAMYRIIPMGRMALNWEFERLQRQIDLAKDRSLRR